MWVEGCSGFYLERLGGDLVLFCWLKWGHFPKKTLLFHFGDFKVVVGETRIVDDPKCGLG
jgi:hypothetical protein